MNIFSYHDNGTKDGTAVKQEKNVLLVPTHCAVQLLMVFDASGQGYKTADIGGGGRFGSQLEKKLPVALT